MPDKPVPLREALAESVASLVFRAADFIPHNTTAEAELRRIADRVGALIEQVPIDLEAREGDDGNTR